MQNLLAFTLITIMFSLAKYHIMAYFKAMIQEDGLLDRAFGYKKMLDKLYGSNNKALRSLGDALGNCEMCMSFWFAMIWFIVYFFFCYFIFGVWVTNFVTTHSWYITVIIGVIWFFVVHGLMALVGFMALKKSSKDGL